MLKRAAVTRIMTTKGESFVCDACRARWVCIVAGMGGTLLTSRSFAQTCSSSSEDPDVEYALREVGLKIGDRFKQSGFWYEVFSFNAQEHREHPVMLKKVGGDDTTYKMAAESVLKKVRKCAGM